MISTRIAGSVLTGVLALGLTAGVASAHQTDTRPVKGTAACSNLVNGQSDVLLARGTVQQATSVLNVALRATPIVDAVVALDRQNLADAQAHLKVVVGNVTDSLCQDRAVTTEPKPVTPAPTPTSTVVEHSTTVVEQPEHTTVVNKVVPTLDDGSVAATSGSQVSAVPEGSASTGEA